ncbi:MAG: hypothetical protein L3K10_01420 [Thermoplasmata archaeon]|nr:hypothetical protein [Thermoplasmata archaeon]
MPAHDARRRSRTLLAVAVGLLIAASSVGVAFVLSPHSAPAAVASCLRSDSQVADPTAPHGEFVLAPPIHPHDAYYADVQATLLHNPVVCGADFWVPWNSVDAGPTSHAEYNFTSTDAAAATWVAAGKEVNLIFQMVGTSANQEYVPSTLLSEVPTIQCGDSAVTPVAWNATFESAYRAFMAATVHHYGTIPGIGYLRFGFGVAGDSNPVQDINAPGCQNQLNAVGFTLTVWKGYLTSMLAYERSLNSSFQLMVALTPVYPDQGDNVTPAVATAAAGYGIGIGNEGLRANDSADIDANGIGCGGYGWCKEFSKFAGVVPLELQTVSATSPNGTGPVGSLVPLLPFALTQHTQIFEIYLEDWLTAFDPNYPAYPMYHSAYAQALAQTALVVGTSAG